MAPVTIDGRTRDVASIPPRGRGLGLLIALSAGFWTAIALLADLAR